MIGRTLSHFKILEKLGEGGMGVVWKAEDSVLGREVAIKVLPDEFAQDPERLARFRQEARLLASLNHPNIAAIHGFEETDGVRFLVMELIPGQTLAERLKGGPLPVDEALTVCRQIAEALEAAHENGIIHRDLKPGNVKVTPDGKVKVLDFGLAKAFEAEGVAGDLSHSPTLTSPPTRAGVLLGTAAYMSPEQARGKPLDKRTDIWSFGCVLYETLTGKQAFGGESITDVLAAIVKEEPAWERLPSATPPSIRQLLRRCLAKDPKTRLKDIGDAYWNFGEEDDSFSTLERGGRSAAISHRLRDHFVSIIVALALGVGLGWLIFHLTIPIQPDTVQVARFSLSLPSDTPLVYEQWPASNLAIAPNGSSIVYMGEDRRAGRLEPGLYIRQMDELGSRLIPGTVDASQPFFSPDGRWVGFFNNNGELRKISIDGGQPVTVARGIVASSWSFGSWGDDGRIFFDEWTRGLYVVPAEGGEHRPLMPRPESERHREPHVLPGSRAVLFTAATAESDTIRALRLDDGAETTLLENAYHPRFLASGHLLFSREGTLMVVPFDPQGLKIVGTPIPLSLNARIDSVLIASPKSQLAVSRNGTLVYAPADKNYLRSSRFVWVDRRGKVQEERSVPVSLPSFTLSPDGRRTLVADMQGATTRIQVLDLERGTLDLLWRTRQPYLYGALWAPDGSVIHSRTDVEGSRLLVTNIDRSTSTVLVQAPGIDFLAPNSVTRDNRFISYLVGDPETLGDIWVLDRGEELGQIAPVLFVGTPAHEFGAEFSPDGRWVAYVSQETGSAQVYLKRFPGGALKHPVSKEGGTCPVWSPDGREIFYQQVGRKSTPSGEWQVNTRLMAVSVTTETGLRLGEPRPLFEGPYAGCSDNGPGYDISPDGSRFLMVSLDKDPSSTNELVVVLNWFEELKRLSPTESD